MFYRLGLHYFILCLSCYSVGDYGTAPTGECYGNLSYISSDAAEMVKKWAGGIEITISPNICLISLLVIGSISAIVSVLALRKQTY